MTFSRNEYVFVRLICCLWLAVNNVGGEQPVRPQVVFPDIQLLRSWTSAWLICPLTAVLRVSSTQPTPTRICSIIPYPIMTTPPITQRRQKQNWRDRWANGGESGHLVNPVDPVSWELESAPFLSHGISSIRVESYRPYLNVTYLPRLLPRNVKWQWWNDPSNGNSGSVHT